MALSSLRFVYLRNVCATILAILGCGIARHLLLQRNSKSYLQSDEVVAAHTHVQKFTINHISLVAA